MHARRWARILQGKVKMAKEVTHLLKKEKAKKKRDLKAKTIQVQSLKKVAQD